MFEITVIIGNLLALAAALLAILSGMVKTRKRSIFLQFLHEFCCASGDFILGGYSGAIVDCVDAARDALSYKDKLTQNLKYILIFIASALIFYFNDMGLIGFLPLVATVFYTLTINIKDPVKYKLCLMVTWVLSLIYNLAILSFVGALVQAFALAGGLFSLLRTDNFARGNSRRH